MKLLIALSLHKKYHKTVPIELLISLITISSIQGAILIKKLTHFKNINYIIDIKSKNFQKSIKTLKKIELEYDWIIIIRISEIKDYYDILEKFLKENEFNNNLNIETVIDNIKIVAYKKGE